MFIGAIKDGDPGASLYATPAKKKALPRVFTLRRASENTCSL
jgi:hypothetical protein